MWAKAYTMLAGSVLFVQGATTLAALLVPAFDKTFPFLLALTKMIPIHSSLHLATAAVALASMALARTRLFAIGFGLFYLGLAISGWLTGSGLCLALQPFDHPFHLFLGLLGVGAWTLDRFATRALETAR